MIKQKIFSPIYFWLLAALLSCVIAPVHALDIVQIRSDAKNWKLEQYTNGGIVVWFSESRCENGKLAMREPGEEKVERFWATVMAAKVSGKQLFVRYDADDGCLVRSFGMW